MSLESQPDTGAKRDFRPDFIRGLENTSGFRLFKPREILIPEEPTIINGIPYEQVAPIPAYYQIDESSPEHYRVYLSVAARRPGSERSIAGTDTLSVMAPTVEAAEAKARHKLIADRPKTRATDRVGILLETKFEAATRYLQPLAQEQELEQAA